MVWESTASESIRTSLHSQAWVHPQGQVAFLNIRNQRGSCEYFKKPSSLSYLSWDKEVSDLKAQRGLSSGSFKGWWKLDRCPPWPNPQHLHTSGSLLKTRLIVSRVSLLSVLQLVEWHPSEGSSWDFCLITWGQAQASFQEAQQPAPETIPHPCPLVILVCFGHMPRGQYIKVWVCFKVCIPFDSANAFFRNV